MNKAEHNERIFNEILGLYKKQLRKKVNMSKAHWSCEKNMDLFGKMDLKVDKLFNLMHEGVKQKRQRKLCFDIANYAMRMILNDVTKETDDVSH